VLDVDDPIVSLRGKTIFLQVCHEPCPEKTNKRKLQACSAPCGADPSNRQSPQAPCRRHCMTKSPSDRDGGAATPVDEPYELRSHHQTH
jgi:hypothetical protein